MPYIIIARTPPKIPVIGSIDEPKLAADGIVVERDKLSGEATAFVSRTAVATLDEARNIVFNVLDGTDHPLIEADTLPESSGTIGPLPDGTVIEIHYLTWIKLRQSTGRSAGECLGIDAQTTRNNVLNAYNNQ